MLMEKIVDRKRKACSSGGSLHRWIRRTMRSWVYRRGRVSNTTHRKKLGRWYGKMWRKGRGMRPAKKSSVAETLNIDFTCVWFGALIDFRWRRTSSISFVLLLHICFISFSTARRSSTDSFPMEQSLHVVYVYGVVDPEHSFHSIRCYRSFQLYYIERRSINATANGYWFATKFNFVAANSD